MQRISRDEVPDTRPEAGQTRTLGSVPPSQSRALALGLSVCQERAVCPGITDDAIRGQNNSILPAERNGAVRRGGPRLRAVINRIV